MCMRSMVPDCVGAGRPYTITGRGRTAARLDGETGSIQHDAMQIHGRRRYRRSESRVDLTPVVGLIAEVANNCRRSLHAVPELTYVNSLNQLGES